MMCRLLICLIVMSVLVFGCRADFGHPDEVPVRGQWYMEPGIKAELDDAQDRFAGDWAEWIYHFQRDECVGRPALGETTPLPQKEAVPGGEGDDDEASLDSEANEASLEEKSAAVTSEEDEVSGEEGQLAETGPAQERQSWICRHDLVEWECLEMATEAAVYDSMSRRFRDLPPTMQPPMLDAYVDDFFWALDMIADAETLEAGVDQAKAVCEEEGSPLAVAVEDWLVPDLRERWGWSRGQRFPDELPGYILDELVGAPCRMAADYHRRYLKDFKATLNRWSSTAPECFE